VGVPVKVVVPPTQMESVPPIVWAPAVNDKRHSTAKMSDVYSFFMCLF
jgi:hypothetical protein